MPILSAESLHIGFYHQKKPVKLLASESNLQLHSGNFTCLLGPNGSGKSTLIRTLAGLQKSIEGRVLLQNQPVENIGLKKKAFLLSMVLTEQPTTANLTVQELVAMGRYPYTGVMGRLGQEDMEKTEAAILHTQLEYLRHKKIWQLSDGERQKAMVARALAQDTPLIMLDEPTAHLDLNNRVELMYLLKDLSHRLNKAVLLSTHDLDIALQCADIFWLMQPCEKILSGTPEDLVLQGEFEKTFKGNRYKFEKSTGTFKVLEEGGKKVSLEGEGIAYFWTKHALERNGFLISETQEKHHISTMPSHLGKTAWKLQLENKDCIEVSTIEALLQALK